MTGGVDSWGLVLRIRRGTDAQWTLANPILGDGEPGYVTDNNWYKIGDGVTPWNDLPYTTGLPGPEGPEGPEGPKGDPGDFPDTPFDGVLYGRRDGVWVAVPGATLEEAPVDGVAYIRLDGGWSSADDRFLTSADATAAHDALQANIDGKEDTGVAATLDSNHVGAADPHSQYLQDAPVDGNQYARQNGSWAQVSGAGGGSTYNIDGLPIYSAMALFDPTTPGNYLTVCRTDGVIYSGTNPARAIQTAIDRVSNFDGSNTYRGGKVGIGSGFWLITSPILGRPVSTTWTMPDSDVFPVHIVGEGGIRGAPAGSNSSAGTHIQWAGASNPTTTDAMGVARTGYTLTGAVFNLSNDAHGYRVEDIVIKAGEQIADYAAVSAGRGVEWWRCQFRESKRIGLYITNGADTAHDRYVQQRIMFCRSESNGTDSIDGIGYKIANLAGGSGCTDGRAYDIQTSNNTGWSVEVSQGGWQFTGGHLTGGTGTRATMVIAAMTAVSDIYFDTNGPFPCLEINNSNVQISNCRLWSTNRGGINLVEGGGSSGVFLSNCLVYGNHKANYLYNGVGAAVHLVGCGGPSATLTALAPPGINLVGSSIW